MQGQGQSVILELPQICITKKWCAIVQTGRKLTEGGKDLLLQSNHSSPKATLLEDQFQ